MGAVDALWAERGWVGHYFAKFGASPIGPTILMRPEGPAEN